MTLEGMAEVLGKPQRLGDQVADVLRQAIVEGKFDSGDRLVASEIASQLGISRTPAREAIRHLERDGLVTVSPSGETVVTTLAIDDLEDITMVRQLIEPYATRLTAARATSDELVGLEQVNALMCTAAENGDVRLYIRLNEAFHSAVYEASGSPILARMVRALNFPLYFRQIALIPQVASLDNMMARLDEHRAILAAIRSCNTEIAEQASRDHVRQSLGIIRSEQRDSSEKA